MKNVISFCLIIALSGYFCYKKVAISTSAIEKGNYGVIDWDNFGYYLYLPAIFINDDLKLLESDWVKDAQKKYNLSSSYYQAHKIENKNHVIQYTCGMAIIYSPAFFIGHLVAVNTSYPSDGFSEPYQLALLVQSFLMVFLGLFFLRKLSLCFYNDWLSSALIIFICCGTNYWQIVPANISSPHVYLFAFYSALLYYIFQWHKAPKLGYSVVIGVLSAIMILSRANELLFLLVPILWLGGTFNNYKQKTLFFWNNKKHILAVTLPLFLFGILQPLYWHYTTGEWIFDSYPNEDFKLLNPYLKEYLFSYKKGWLLYTPLMFFALLGLVSLWRKNQKIGIPITLFILLNIWVLSSWDCWWYADSFSQRSIVQSYPIFLIPLGYLLKDVWSSPKLVKYSVYAVLFVFLSFNLFQVWQFQNGIIHSQRMTKEYYWSAFGATSKDQTNRLLLDVDRQVSYLPEKEISNKKTIFQNSYSSYNINSSVDFNGYYIPDEGSLQLTKTNRTSEILKFAYKDICDTSFCYIVSKIRYKSNFESKVNPFGIEFNMIDASSGKSYKKRYRGVEHINWFQKGSWSSMDLVVIPPFLRSENDTVQVNVVLKGDYPVLIDNFSVEVLSQKKIYTKNSQVYYNDFHTLKSGEWSKNTSITKGKGYQRIDALNQYSSSLIISQSEVNNKKLIVQANVNLKNNYSGAGVVISIDSAGNQTYYKSYPLIRNSEDWEKQSFEFDIPKLAKSNNAVLKAYLWNKSEGPVFLRDIKVTVED